MAQPKPASSSRSPSVELTVVDLRYGQLGCQGFIVLDKEFGQPRVKSLELEEKMVGIGFGDKSKGGKNPELYMGVEPKIGEKKHPKWMVYNGKTLWTNGWFGGTTIFGNIHICKDGEYLLPPKKVTYWNELI